MYKTPKSVKNGGQNQYQFVYQRYLQKLTELQNNEPYKPSKIRKKVTNKLSAQKSENEP